MELAEPMMNMSLLVLKLSNDSKIEQDILKPIAYKLNIEEIRQKKWHLSAVNLASVEYGIVLFKQQIVGIITLGEVTDLDDRSFQLPKAKVLPFDLRQMNNWLPWYLLALVGHPYNYSTSNTASVVVLNRVGWNIPLQRINDDFWNTYLLPIMNQASPELHRWLDQQRQQLLDSSQKYDQQLKRRAGINNYGYNTLVELYLDWAVCYQLQRIYRYLQQRKLTQLVGKKRD